MRSIADNVQALLASYGMPLQRSMPGSLDYIAAGYVDSLKLLRFVLDLEKKFKIDLFNADIASPEFRTFGGLCIMIERKLNGGAQK